MDCSVYNTDVLRPPPPKDLNIALCMTFLVILMAAPLKKRILQVVIVNNCMLPTNFLSRKRFFLALHHVQFM
jgi:hypothetical protein